MQLQSSLLPVIRLLMWWILSRQSRQSSKLLYLRTAKIGWRTFSWGCSPRSKAKQINSSLSSEWFHISCTRKHSQTLPDDFLEVVNLVIQMLNTEAKGLTCHWFCSRLLFHTCLSRWRGLIQCRILLIKMGRPGGIHSSPTVHHRDGQLTKAHAHKRTECDDISARTHCCTIVALTCTVRVLKPINSWSDLCFSLAGDLRTVT